MTYTANLVLRDEVPIAAMIQVQVSWDITPCRLVNTDVSECSADTCSIKMEAVRFSEISVTIYQSTRRNIPGDVDIHLILLG